MRYPKEIDTDEKKLRFLYRAQTFLQWEHNEKGKTLSSAAFEVYRKARFFPLSQKLGEAICPLRDTKVDAIVATKVEAGETYLAAREAAGNFKRGMLEDDTFDAFISLDDLRE